MLYTKNTVSISISFTSTGDWIFRRDRPVPTEQGKHFLILLGNSRINFSGIVKFYDNHHSINSRTPTFKRSLYIVVLTFGFSRFFVLSTVITVPDDQMPLLPPRDATNKGLEIIKSIVYGGLTEAIASLSIVASAASADTATGN